jgi:hypothetical protein
MNRIPAILLAILLILCAQALPAQSATYYISPAGSDANPGTSAKPWLTFAYAIDPARANCGDTLVLMNGTYGDGTSTGKININGVMCTLGNEFKLTAQNQRQAKIVDNGSGYAVRIENSAYLIVDGLYVRSTDNSEVGSNVGRVLEVHTSDNIIVRNNLFRNPNRYGNTPSTGAYYSSNVLFEDNESYIFHRHCVTAWHGERVVVRRQYCNPRGGAIAGGVGAQNGTNRADAVFSMYPCKDCILENSIGDGTTSGLYLVEMNATYGSGILMSGSKVLGSMCYKCNYGNGIYANARKVADLTHTPQNLMVRDVAFIDHASRANAIRCSDCVNVVFDHISILGTGAGLNGVTVDDTSYGATPAQQSVTLTNLIVTNMTQYGFRINGPSTWSGKELVAYNNGTNLSPSLPATWTNTSTSNPGLGTCKVWIPAGAAVKGAGTGGSDIGANILYRYVNGVLTSTPLWDPTTGEFPHGARDLDGTNRVEGQSLFDIHKRLNVNTGGCSFPRNYGDGNSDTSIPAAPIGLRAS